MINPHLWQFSLHFCLFLTEVPLFLPGRSGSEPSFDPLWHWLQCWISGSQLLAPRPWCEENDVEPLRPHCESWFLYVFLLLFNRGIIPFNGFHSGEWIMVVYTDLGSCWLNSWRGWNMSWLGGLPFHCLELWDEDLGVHVLLKLHRTTSGWNWICNILQLWSAWALHFRTSETA